MSGDYLRTSAVIKALRPFLKSDETVLDIGAGSCTIARRLDADSGLAVTAVDVVDHNKTNFPLRLYDGQTLPYDDTSFDVGLLVFVLHHAPDPERLIREALRVCRRVVVVEDMPGNAAEKFSWEKLDYALNHAVHKDIHVAHAARTRQEWEEFFAANGLKVVGARKFRSFFTTLGLYPHEVFVLESA